MIKNLSRFILISTSLCLIMIFAAVPVSACSYTTDIPTNDLEARVHNAPMIIVGTVIGGYDPTYVHGYEQVEVEVEQYLRGEGSGIVWIDGFGYGPDCLSFVRHGQKAIFFVEGSSDKVLDAVYLVAHDATWNADPENIETIMAITGENNMPYPFPLTMQIMRFLTQYTTWIITLSLLALVFAFAPMILRRIRNPRKSKAKRS